MHVQTTMFVSTTASALLLLAAGRAAESTAAKTEGHKYTSSNHLTNTTGEMPRWPDSSTGIHTLVVFDDQTTRPDMQKLTAAGGVPDFVWGGSPANVPVWRQLNPKVIVSKYLSFAWVEFHNEWDKKNLSWWKANHPGRTA